MALPTQLQDRDLRRAIHHRTYPLSECPSDSRTLLTLRRMASTTSSSASATLDATTTPKRPHLNTTSYPSGNIAGAPSKWASHLATCNCSYCGRRLATCLISARARRGSRAPGLRLRRVCRCRWREGGRRIIEVGNWVGFVRECIVVGAGMLGSWGNETYSFALVYRVYQ